MSNNGSQQFEFHPLELSQLDAVLALEQEALDNLERPDLLRRNTLDMWHKCLQPPHLCLGAWVRGELVGFAVLYVPAKGDAEDLSALLVQVDATPYISANFKICIVHPQWRGRHLQCLIWLCAWQCHSPYCWWSCCAQCLRCWCYGFSG